MSMLTEYENSKNLEGFTLGYTIFFTQFKISPDGYLYWNNNYLTANSNDIQNIMEFINTQLVWIQSKETQDKMKNKSKYQIRDECKKRIDFFVLKLTEKITGQTPKAPFYLRDIRNLGLMCLK
jgi:hypothetical protein